MAKVKNEANILLWDQLGELNTWHKQEFRFAPPRKWRFDFAIANGKRQIGIEIDGAVWTNGRHTRGKGFIADMEKQNFATFLGWSMLRFTPAQVLDGSAIAFIRRVLEAGG